MRILLAENDRDLRTFFGTKLRDEFKGTIDLASTGKETIKLLKSERPYDVMFSILFFQMEQALIFSILRSKTKSMGHSFSFVP